MASHPFKTFAHRFSVLKIPTAGYFLYLSSDGTLKTCMLLSVVRALVTPVKAIMVGVGLLKNRYKIVSHVKTHLFRVAARVNNALARKEK